MSSRPDAPTTRVQVYFENPKVEKALRREAAVAKIPLSRAAERAIERGLQKRPTADPEDRLLNLDRALRDHMRSTRRDMALLQEMIAELVRALFLRLPDSPGDDDALLQAAADARVNRLVDVVVARVAAGEALLSPPKADELNGAGSPAQSPPEGRSFHAPAP